VIATTVPCVQWQWWQRRQYHDDDEHADDDNATVHVFESYSCGDAHTAGGDTFFAESLAENIPEHRRQKRGIR